MLVELRKYMYLLTLLSSVLLQAQVPQKISYQAVVRNSSNELIVASPIGVKISLLQGSATGTPVYVETQVPNTNNNGLISIAIGAGTVVSGAITTINWANGPYFIKTEVDPAGGSNYSITGATELLSVPYALYSQNGPSNAIVNGTAIGQMLYWNGSSWATFNPGSQNMVLTYCNTTPLWTATGVCGVTAPTVQSLTQHVNNTYTRKGAYANGTVTSDGNSPVTARGFCWSTTNANPILSNSNVSNFAPGTGPFSIFIDPGVTGTVYYRSFATNVVGTSYGEVKSFYSW